MKKGRIITISIIAAVAVLLIILSCTLFNLRSVDIEYLAQTENSLVVSKDSIRNAGNFKIGTNLLFNSFDDNVAMIEKQCPNIKVVKTIKKFPNKLTVYVVEREAQLRILGEDGYYYIFDDEMKVVQKTATPLEYQNYLEVIGYLLPKDLELGDFLKDSDFGSKMEQILDGIYSAGRTPSSIMSNITLGKNDLDKQQFLFKFKSGSEMKIVGTEKLEQRVFNGITTYNNESQNLSVDELSIFKILVNANTTCTVKYDEEW